MIQKCLRLRAVFYRKRFVLFQAHYGVLYVKLGYAAKLKAHVTSRGILRHGISASNYARSGARV